MYPLRYELLIFSLTMRIPDFNGEDGKGRYKEENLWLQQL